MFGIQCVMYGVRCSECEAKAWLGTDANVLGFVFGVRLTVFAIRCLTFVCLLFGDWYWRWYLC